MGAVRGALLTLIAAACLTVGAIAVAQEPPPGEAPDRRPMDDNPCLTERAKRLLCPDLVMRRPYGLYTERLTKPGHTVLRAGNVIDSVGKGPAELHGTRIGPRFMTGRQRIYKRGGGKIGISTGARLQFKFAHQQLYWWKFYDAARFELWRLDEEGRRTRLARTGPKVAYCLRDLGHTRPRLRGCFAYAHIADPENGIYESDEDNNEAQVVVRLPFERGNARRGCKGRDRGRPYGPRTPY